MAATKAYEYTDHQFDVVVVGAGGAGLRAALGMAEQGLQDRLYYQSVSRPALTPWRRRAALRQPAQHGPDHWQWHMYDTVKGSDWLGDTDAMEYLAREAPAAVYELEHYGVPFSRTEEGKIYQRPFGGTCTNFGEGRRCSAPARRLTEPAMPSCTRCTAQPEDTTPSSSSSISPST